MPTTTLPLTPSHGLRAAASFNLLYVLSVGDPYGTLPKAEFSIVTRASSSAWIPELIASAGAQVTETYIDFFTSTEFRPKHSSCLRSSLLAVF